MKQYKDFETVSIGESDGATLFLTSYNKQGKLYFGEDGGYKAYECFGEVEIPERYTLIYEGEKFLTICDDFGLTYHKQFGHDQDTFRNQLFSNPDLHLYHHVSVYRCGAFGCIIHWHD